MMDDLAEQRRILLEVLVGLFGQPDRVVPFPHGNGISVHSKAHVLSFSDREIRQNAGSADAIGFLIRQRLRSWQFKNREERKQIRAA